MDNSIPEDVRKQIDEIASAYVATGTAKTCLELGYNLASKALSDLKAENERLRDWKESSMSVTPDMQAIGKALGVKLGESVHDKILPGIEGLKDKLEAAKLALKEIYTGTDFPLSIAQNALQILEIK